MRKNILIAWFIIVIASSTFLAYSIVYEIDSYQTVLNFTFEVTDVALTKNSSGTPIHLQITADIWNPSFLSKITLNSIYNSVRLNDHASEYLQKTHWLFKRVSPRKTVSAVWSYTILQQDAYIFNEASTENSWNWDFSITVNLISQIVDQGHYDKSQLFQGVREITI
jgi:hypothetical protein